MRSVAIPSKNQKLKTVFDEGENQMDVKTLSEVIVNQGFPITLSILLIFRIDKFMQEIVAYFGNIRTLFPVTSGQRFGIIRTA